MQSKCSSYIWKFLEIEIEFYTVILLTQCTVVLKFPSGFDLKKNFICYLLGGKGLLHPNPNFQQSVNLGDNMWYFLNILKIHKCHIKIPPPVCWGLRYASHMIKWKTGCGDQISFWCMPFVVFFITSLFLRVWRVYACMFYWLSYIKIIHIKHKNYVSG